MSYKYTNSEDLKILLARRKAIKDEIYKITN